MSSATSSAPASLQPLDFPLRGSRLIEASAGTGKTFTIAALYLRLVLGHGSREGDDATAFPRRLTPPEILVVTFTEAATGELRDRIRARLAEAAERFLADPDAIPQPVPAPGTDLLHDLRASFPTAEWPACARRLRLAAEWMDEAAVMTIHGWCNRMLREHAFDSGSLFTQTLEADQRELLAEAVRDYWRTFYYPLDGTAVQEVRQWWPTPERLHDAIRRLLALELDAVDTEPSTALDKAREDRAAALADIKAPWARWAEELETLFDGAVALKQVDARKLQARFYKPWLDELSAWALGEHVQPLKDASTGWTRLTNAGIAEVWKGAEPVPSHPAFDAMEALRDRLRALPDGREDVLRHAIRWIGARFATAQERRAQVGFDDLLARLGDALRGPNGERLAALIRRQFPVAMIDEFQDTDPVQYRIFDAIYRVADNDRATALVLIGDPKQAIYAFRGADIHTYLAARRDTHGRHATLGTNFRSTSAMVRAANHVFHQAERHDHGRGAFLFRNVGGDGLPFFPVDAKGRRERLQVDGADVAALNCWWIDDRAPIGTGEHTRRLSAACAVEVVRLLRLGQQGRAGFASDGAPPKALAANDIAVLVNNRNEARAVRQELAARGVRSVFLSNDQSVFDSAVAADLQRWLEACAEPEDGRLLRAALGTPTLGLGWHALDRLRQDELHWEARMLRFREYLQCWRRQGVLPMLRRLLHDFDVPRRLLERGDERTLTDLLHLAELLQAASEVLDGEHALIRYLAEQRGGAGGDSDVRQVRLESDAELVKVVTVHKSKGLEYPLVFLPFASAFRAAKPTDSPLAWHDEQGRLQIALTPDAQAVQRADAERLGEDLRKFYVALTRARFATWIGVAPLAGSERSALGHLVAGGEPIAPGTVASQLEHFRDGCVDIAVLRAPEPRRGGDVDGEERYQPAFAPPRRRAPLPLPKRRDAWWIASYSALRIADVDDVAPTDDRAALAAGPTSASEETFAESGVDDRRDLDDGTGDELRVAIDDVGAADSLHAFPRGASAGNFLHGLLEWAGREGFDAIGADPQKLEDQVARRCNVQGWSQWIAPLGRWLRAWVDTPLPLGEGVARRPADFGRVQVEMEFWFATTQVDTQALDALVRSHTLDRMPRPALQASRLNGMLKGFIDLVLECDGRYYVADYKSNWLGPADEDYTRETMRAAVLEHRYELQYVLYLFALHRLLRARLPGYDYDTHVGGAVYVFLRGGTSPSRGVHVERPPKALIDALETLFTAGGEMHA